MTSRIRVLPDNLANQIAAGEVVERPASVVKELVENSIDAGAGRINIEVELGGRRLIRISDDGEGMVRDDAVLSFERHATSKISRLEDLSAIGTLGFRGEALASIASVARVELTTRSEPDDRATRVRIEAGRLVDVTDQARAVGTTIAVRDLFFNTPARRKFMRSEATENFHIASIVTHYALANPSLGFSLSSNGREVLRVTPARDLRERAFQLFGGQLVDSLLPVSFADPQVCGLSGFVSAPRERRTSRDSQYFFVNRRFVRDKVASGGLSEGFRAVLPHGVYPVAFLFIDIPAEEVDVNVHPAKTEVRFRRSDAIRDAIASAVRDALARGGIAAVDQHSVRSSAPASGAGPVTEPANLLQSLAPGSETTSGHPESVSKLFETGESAPSSQGHENLEAKLRESISSFHLEVPDHSRQVPPDVRAEDAGTPLGLPPVDSAVRAVKSAEISELNPSKIRPIAQLHDSFIIAVDDQGLLLVDQHVAHERILFDKFRSREDSRPVESQQLLIPFTLELTPAQSLAFDEVEDTLEQLGFGLVKLSGRTVVLKAVPADVAGEDAQNLLAELLDSVESHKRGRAPSSLRDEIAASLACKAAVKINMRLSPEKMQWLVDRLLTTSSPTTCPHGRPVVLRLTMKDIERGFHRT